MFSVENLPNTRGDTSLITKKKKKNQNNKIKPWMQIDGILVFECVLLYLKTIWHFSILVGKLHELEIVQSVMNIFRDISEEEIQLVIMKQLWTLNVCWQFTLF